MSLFVDLLLTAVFMLFWLPRRLSRWNQASDARYALLVLYVPEEADKPFWRRDRRVARELQAEFRQKGFATRRKGTVNLASAD
jgi:hypothetical protein